MTSSSWGSAKPPSAGNRSNEAGADGRGDPGRTELIQNQGGGACCWVPHWRGWLLILPDAPGGAATPQTLLLHPSSPEKSRRAATDEEREQK